MKDYLTLIRWLVATIVIVISHSSFTQEKVKYGIVSKADLEMEYYPSDTTAPAAILYDRGYFNGTRREFTRHTRLKIFNATGTQFGTFIVRTPFKSLIDGVTYNLVDGHVVETKLSNDNIYKEEIENGFSVYKVFCPDIKPGSVVDIRYTFSGLPYVWRFQNKIPVRFSELVLEPTRSVDFKRTYFGPPINLENDGFRWTARDVPAFLEEPFMNDFSNYVAHFRIDISRLFYTEYSSSWKSIGERLLEAPQFGGVMEQSAFLNDKAKEIKASSVPLEVKIKMAYEYIQSNIKWNKISSPYTSSEYHENFKKNHSGNSAEINLTLVTLLKKSGLDAYAAVLSTRDNGLLNPANASASTINYVIGYVKNGDTGIILDATDTDIPPGVLPERCRNLSAYVVNKPEGWWIDTSVGKKSVRRQFISIQANDAGIFVANVKSAYHDYDFLEWLPGFTEHGTEEAYTKNVLASGKGEIDQCELKLEKQQLKATETRIIRMNDTNYLHDLGSELVINPFIFSDITNPFKQETRNHPIDFKYPRSRSIHISLVIPPQYTLRSKPQALALKPASGGAKFTYLVDVTNNNLTIKVNLEIENQIYSPSDYALLREFFIQVDRKMSESIQLDKKI
jgi:hypothetical protein